MTALQAGNQAPDFTLKDTEGSEVSLAQLRQGGRSVILAFFPAAWTSVCGSEMSLYQELLSDFEQLDATVVGISEDNTPSISAWADTKGFTFTLLSDFNPKGEVARKYGVLREDGRAERALFIIDSDGVIRYSYVSPISVNPGADRLFDVLEQMAEERNNDGRDAVQRVA